MAILVEFVGTPATGKTTVARMLLAELRSAGLTCADLQPMDNWLPPATRRGPAAVMARAVRFVAHAAADVRLGFWTALLVMSMRPWTMSHLLRARRFIGWVRQTRGIERRLMTDLAILDQGGIQLLISNVMHAAWHSAACFDRVLDHLLGLPRIIVIAQHAHTEDVLQRLRKRNRIGEHDRFRLWRQLAADEPQALALIGEHMAHVRHVAERLAMQQRIKAIHVDSARDPKANARLIRAAILAVIERGSAAAQPQSEMSANAAREQVAQP